MKDYFGNFGDLFNVRIFLLNFEWTLFSVTEHALVLLLIVFLLYCYILLSLSSIFSIGLFGSIISLTSDNFECGFYPILSVMLKYKINYWMITIHFLIFEQELILVLLLTFGLKTLNENNLLCLLLGILFIDLIISTLRYNFWSFEMKSIPFIFFLFYWFARLMRSCFIGGYSSFDSEIVLVILGRHLYWNVVVN